MSVKVIEVERNREVSKKEVLRTSSYIILLVGNPPPQIGKDIVRVSASFKKQIANDPLLGE